MADKILHAVYDDDDKLMDAINFTNFRHNYVIF